MSRQRLESFGEVLGGPTGRRAARGGIEGWLGGPGPLALLAAVPLVLAVVRQGHCIGSGWSGVARLVRMCHSDLVSSVQTDRVGRGLAAYLSGEVPLEQPPLAGLVMSLLGGLAPGGSPVGRQRWFLLLWCALAMACLAAVAWFTAQTREHPWADPLQAALSPVVVLTVLLAPDLVGVTLVAAGFWAWGRRSPLLAGAPLGAGVMARTYPLLALAVLVLMALRTHRTRELPRLGAGASLGLLACALPFVAHPGTLVSPWRAWAGAGTDLGSPWHLLALAGHPLSPLAATIVAVLGWVVALALTGLLALGSPRRPTVAAVLLVAIALVLVTGKSFPVQASIWLVPVVALTGLRRRDHLLWAFAEASHFVAVWLYAAGKDAAVHHQPDRGLPAGWYAVTLVLRVAAVLYLAWRAWQLSMHEGLDDSNASDDAGLGDAGLGSSGWGSSAEPRATVHPDPATRHTEAWRP